MIKTHLTIKENPILVESNTTQLHSNAVFEEKTLQVTKVTKVVKGGKILTFRVLVVIGNKEGKVGIGLGRAEEIGLATEKAILDAKKNLIEIVLNNNYSILKMIVSKYGSTKVLLKPASLGHGIIAGSSIRTILEFAGIKNITAKQLGSNNLLNNAKATIQALSLLSNNIQFL